MPTLFGYVQVTRQGRSWTARVLQHGLRPSGRRPKQEIGDPGMPEVYDFGPPRGGGPKAHRRILRPDGAETHGGGLKGHRRVLRPNGPVDHAGPVPDGGMARLPLRQKASRGISQECTVAVEGYYCKLCESGS